MMELVPEGRKTQFKLAPGETFIQCPYDESHCVTDKRLLVHLQKCRRNYILSQEGKGLEVEFSFCKFNYVHQVPRVEIAFHEKHCDYQYSVLKHMAFHSTKDFTKFKQTKIAETAEIAKTLEDNKDEEWDMSGPGYKYDPSANMEKKPNLYGPNNVTYSERKKYQVEHRRRFKEYLTKMVDEEEDGGNGKEKTVFVTKKDVVEDSEVTTPDYPSNRASDGVSGHLTNSREGGRLAMFSDARTESRPSDSQNGTRSSRTLTFSEHYSDSLF